MSGRRLAVESDAAISLEDIVRRGVRDRPDVAALASLDGKKLSVLAWHYHDDDVPGPAAQISLVLTNLSTAVREARLQHFRIDENHSNAFAAWKRIGSPQQPTPDQYAQLEKAAQLASLGAPENVRIQEGKATIEISLPRQAVSLLQLTW
jgi:xylan 1,4-beta-xylosidase